MRIRRRLAAGTAAAFAALAVLSAPAAHAATAAPAAPTNVSLTPAAGSLKASWGAVGADPAVTRYQISVSASGTPVTGSPFSAGEGITNAVVSGLTAGTIYTVTVRASNALGDSPASRTLTGAPTAGPAASTATGPIAVVRTAAAAPLVAAAAATGTLTMTVPSGPNLGTAIDVPGGSRTASGALGAVTVTDTRVAAEQTPWKIQATVADFTGSSGAAVFSFAQLGWSTPSVTGTGVTAGLAQVAGSASALRLLANGTSGASGSVDAGLSLVVPAGTAVGTYQSLITIDLVKV
jgi:Fibronectin type III domain